MNTILLQPNDILFFRDGRPMSGASTGHGAAWPYPHVLNAAFHAALHRAEIENVHAHRSGRSSQRDRDAKRDQKFGSLCTVGPFPVDGKGEWFFPRPADAQSPLAAQCTLIPDTSAGGQSSLREGLHPVLNTQPPSKEQPSNWFSRKAWQHYLDANVSELPKEHFPDDAVFSCAEHQIGIVINPDSGSTQDGGFYSAQYLRLANNWKLGLLAEAIDKINGSKDNKRDLICQLLDKEQHLLVGGQQRICTAERVNSGELPLPQASAKMESTYVKWTLLSPAIFPEIGEHTGGWLPNWVDMQLNVQLLDGPGKNKAKRLGVPAGQAIRAKLVSAVVTGAQAITGYSNSGDSVGAKSTHLAVPAGSVYYFQAENHEQAQKLADALNWHGSDSGTDAKIHNRRSTLFGEKGFGLGVCSTWKPLSK